MQRRRALRGAALALLVLIALSGAFVLGRALRPTAADDRGPRPFTPRTANLPIGQLGAAPPDPRPLRVRHRPRR